MTPREHRGSLTVHGTRHRVMQRTYASAGIGTRSGKERERTMVERRIVGFHQDEEHHWVADLECGHTQHVRHDPPWQVRPWVITPEGRERFLGTTLRCVVCDPGSWKGR